MSSRGVEKDTGWSCLVLVAVFLTQSIVFGLLFCFGIYFVTLLDHFDCTKREVAIVGSLAYGIKCLTSPLSSVLCRRFGSRAVVMCGGGLASLGCLLSYFATSLLHLYLSYGCLLGVGLGLVFTPSISVLTDYFDKYRYFATAFATVGSAMGTFVFQPIFFRLINEYSWRGSMLINAGIALQIVALGAFMRSKTRTTTELTFDVRFWLLFVNAALVSGSIYTIFSLFNSLAISHGISKSQSALLASLLGVGNICGRFCSSVVGHWTHAHRLCLHTVATALLIVGALTVVVLPPSFSTMAVGLTLFGVGFGAMAAQFAGVMMELFGVARLATVLGYGMLACGLGGLTLPVVAGRLADDEGNVESAFYLAICCSTFAVSLAVVNLIIQWRQRNRERRMEGTD